MAAIELEDVEVDLGEFALAIQNIIVSRGTITRVVGPNGSGKSTLCRAIMGVQPIAIGKRLCKPEIQFGYVPQAYREALMPWMTALQNLMLFRESSFRHLLWASRMGITRAELSRRPRRLSGGQCQRIVLIRETLLFPTCLVLDEPFSSLDITSVNLASELVLKAVARGTAVVLVSHSQLPVTIQHAVGRQYKIERVSERRALVLELQ